MTIRLLRRNTSLSDTDLGSFLPTPSIWLHSLSMSLTFSKNWSSFLLQTAPGLELMFLLFLPGTQFQSPVKLLFVLSPGKKIPVVQLANIACLMGALNLDFQT